MESCLPDTVQREFSDDAVEFDIMFCMGAKLALKSFQQPTYRTIGSITRVLDEGLHSRVRYDNA